ncbi:MAG: HAMP domain-containing histidine kinase [Ruminococcus sp.]|nr:HAMP domain-containing histidine kinase [Ruminococcus sp.]MCM1380537.1 HAMP domain-containing histidine kinase [Muribaculaceae bacterium]MCM1479130.1 HAMP domain-containing histidine kinase [Muribaculaceae bacterium]
MKTAKKCFKSIRHTVWIYFAIFITSILVLMWFTFGVSLESNYKRLKISNIFDIASYILTGWSKDEFTDDTLDTLAYDNDMCVLIQDAYGNGIYSYDMMADNCLIHGVYRHELNKYRAEAAASPNGIFYTEIKNPRFNNDTLLFVMILGEKENPSGYIFLNTSLEPLNSTKGIINSQILWVSVMLLILGLGISYFLTRLIETPIVRITKSAKKLAEGDYSAHFDGHGYAETEQLADTLNYAAEEISKVDNLRRDIIANVSHDLRTPLTMVKAYAEMIRDLSGDNPVKRQEHVNIIIEESDRLAALVNDILDLSKLESNNVGLEPSTFSITKKIYEIMGRYSLLSEQQGYKFFVTADKNFETEADVIKMEQVLYNLINNAVNYTGENKTVYITQLVTDETTARIEITDTGKGIEPELLPLIFDRYYRAEKNKREVIGTGLGLSIVKQILKQHNFKFGVRSEINVGSTFWFEVKGRVIEDYSDYEEENDDGLPEN